MADKAPRKVDSLLPQELIDDLHKSRAMYAEASPPALVVTPAVARTLQAGLEHLDGNLIASEHDLRSARGRLEHFEQVSRIYVGFVENIKAGEHDAAEIREAAADLLAAMY
jgi:hypothetical protein